MSLRQCSPIVGVSLGLLLVAARGQSCGDCGPLPVTDGVVSVLDALVAAQHAAAVLSLPPVLLQACDVHPASGGAGSCDGDVDILDALVLAQAAAGLLVSLDCCQGSPPGAPRGAIRSPGSGTWRGDLPVRLDALDDELDPLDLLLEYTTDGGSSWAAATMSDFVTRYPGYGLSCSGTSDTASYRRLDYLSGSGSFQVGEEVSGGLSGATALVTAVLSPPPGGSLEVVLRSGQLQPCETITGVISGADGVLAGTACGGAGTGIVPVPRPLILGTALFAPPAPASTANPIPGVIPGPALVFVWNTEADVPAPASPATAALRLTLDDGSQQTVVQGSSITIDNRPVATDHLLITELAITGGEFVEIHNPTAQVVDLRDYYLTDATHVSGGDYYWQLASGGSTGGGGGSFDWLARFPPGATIAPGEYLVVAGSNVQFQARYGIDADYEMCLPCTGVIPCMEEAGDGIDSVATCGSVSGTSAFTDSGEMIMLFHWDGVSPTVEDVDYILWGDRAEAIDKTAVPGYLPDTPIPAQEVLPPGFLEGDLHNVNMTASRVDLEEGSEGPGGGNGITGHDETSEDLSRTWVCTGIPTPGRRNLATPPLDDAILPGDVVINEVLYDVPAGADVNGDGVHDPYEDAFIELVNVSGAVVDLSRWRIHNLRTVFGVSHEVPPGTRLDPGQALVIWGGGTPAGTPCNRINQEASEDSLWFNVGVTCDAADGIVLLNGGLYVDGDYQCNNAIDAAFTRSPDLLGSFVDHTTTPTGLPYSPGCREDGVTGF